MLLIYRKRAIVSKTLIHKPSIPGYSLFMGFIDYGKTAMPIYTWYNNDLIELQEKQIDGKSDTKGQRDSNHKFRFLFFSFILYLLTVCSQYILNTHEQLDN